MTSIFTYRPDKSSAPEMTNKPSSQIFKEAPSKKSETEIFQTEPTEQEKPRSFTEKVYDQMKDSEQLKKDIQKNGARTTSRMLERSLGFVGDLQSFIKNITGIKFSPVELPTSGELQKFSEEATGGYTKAENRFQEKMDDLTGDIATSMFPAGKATSLARTLGVPILGSLVKEGVYRSGGSDKAQEGAKLGTMFFLDLLFARKASVPQRGGVKGALDMGGSKKYINSLFQEAEAAIPKGDLADATVLQNSLNNLKRNFSIGGTTPRTAKALQKINEIEGKISNGRIEAESIPGFRKSINDAITELGGYSSDVPHVMKKSAIKSLNDVKKAIIETGEVYGQNNPAFIKPWQMGNEAAAVAGKSNLVSNFVEKVFGDKFKSPLAKTLFGLGSAGTYASGLKYLAGPTAVATGVAGAMVPVYQGLKIGYRVVNSPVLRKYYSNVIKEALQGNAPKTIENLEKLDKHLLEEEKKEQERLKNLSRPKR